MLRFIQLKDAGNKTRYVTKYVEEKFFEDTKAGRLKVGSLAYYRSFEEGADYRFSDTLDGVINTAVYDPIINASFEMDGIKYTNCTFINEGSGASIMTRHEYNAYVYCFVDGSYFKKHHKTFMRKNKNENLNCYVTFDFDSFAIAMAEMFKIYETNRPPLVLASKVHYKPENKKTRTVKLEQLGLVQPSRERAVFVKPDRFSYEDELRIAFFNEVIEDDFLLSQDMGKEIPELFARSVTSFGKI